METKKEISDTRVFLLFLIFLSVAYLPVFLPFLHLKNDFISQNLPTRYFISESLYSGHFPWWNPYIHFGIPQYGDMNNGFWNPFLWIIAKVFGYNIYSMTYEEMFYVFIGGWGMYKLGRHLGMDKWIAITIGLSYMSCGYVLGHLQHFCWITGAAFFPFVMLYYVKINRLPILKNYVIGSIAILFFVSSTHPGLIIGAAYFFLFALTIGFLFRTKMNFYAAPGKYWMINFIFLLTGLLFSVVVIVSDIDVLQHISRGSRVSLQESLLFPTTFPSYLSLLFPIAVNKSTIFATDISMRNVFVGVMTIVGLIALPRAAGKKFCIAVLVPLLFFIMLASGGIFKTAFYYILPFLGYVRLNGEFAYFVILIFLLAGGYGLQKIQAQQGAGKTWKWALLLIAGVALVAMLISLAFMFFKHESIFYSNLENVSNFKTRLKSVIEGLSFPDLLFLSASIQLAVCIIFLKTRFSPRHLTLITASNLILTTWMVLPFTGIGTSSKNEIDKEAMSTPHGLRAQALSAISKTSYLDSTLQKKFVMAGVYSKKIGYWKADDYPIVLNRAVAFFDDTGLKRYINDQAFVFLAADTTEGAKTSFDSSLIRIDNFSPNQISLSISNPGFRFLVFLQNDYPYWRVTVNGAATNHYTCFKTFMAVPLSQGHQQVEFNFKPRPIVLALGINLTIIAIGLALLFLPGLRNKKLVK